MSSTAPDIDKSNGDVELPPQANVSDKKEERAQQILRSLENAGQPSSFGNDVKPIGNLDPLGDEEIRDRQQDRQLKGKYADAFLDIARWQLVGVFFIMLLSGVRVIEFKQNELPIIIAGTLAEVFGIVYIIAKALFNKNNKSPSPSEGSSYAAEKIEQLLRLVKAIRGN